MQNLKRKAALAVVLAGLFMGDHVKAGSCASCECDMEKFQTAMKITGSLLQTAGALTSQGATIAAAGLAASGDVERAKQAAAVATISGMAGTTGASLAELAGHTATAVAGAADAAAKAHAILAALTTATTTTARLTSDSAAAAGDDATAHNADIAATVAGMSGDAASDLVATGAAATSAVTAAPNAAAAAIAALQAAAAGAKRVNALVGDAATTVGDDSTAAGAAAAAPIIDMASVAISGLGAGTPAVDAAIAKRAAEFQKAKQTLDAVKAALAVGTTPVGTFMSTVLDATYQYAVADSDSHAIVSAKAITFRLSDTSGDNIVIPSATLLSEAVAAADGGYGKNATQKDTNTLVDGWIAASTDSARAAVKVSDADSQLFNALLNGLRSKFTMVASDETPGVVSFGVNGKNAIKLVAVLRIPGVARALQAA